MRNFLWNAALMVAIGSNVASTDAAGTGALSVLTSPGMFPSFDPAISDYVVRGASGAGISISISAPPGTQVSVDGQPFRDGSFTARVVLETGQSFPIVASTSGASPETYTIRLLPTDFPRWGVERAGSPQPEWLAVSPDLSLTSSYGPQYYLILFDGYGVPMWWYRDNKQPTNPRLLSDGTIAWVSLLPYEQHRLDGTLVRTINPVDGSPDPHELIPLPSGDYVIIVNRPRGPVDLTALGGPRNAMVIDNVIEEIKPDSTLAWSWSSMDHIALWETVPRWAAAWPLGSNQYDLYHMNSIDRQDDGYVVSFRHLDAVYKIDLATGGVVWKLGGARRHESLTFLSDPYADFGGQHDARVLPDGSLTVHDNGTLLYRAPRAVRYLLDTRAGTATLAERVTDPDATNSTCCGDARKLPGGDWVIDWGHTPYVTEFNASGQRVFRLSFPGYTSYRAEPIPFGQLSRAALRAAMDAQFPRSRPTTPVRPGDLNRDGLINVADAVIALQMAVGIRAVAAADLVAGDLTGDGAITVRDVVAILARGLGSQTAAASRARHRAPCDRGIPPLR